MIHLKHVFKTYQTSLGQSVHALQDVSLSFEATGLVFIFGKSGSGKSTLLNLLGGLDSPSSGELWVDGTHLAQLTDAQKDQYRKTKVGFVFQDFNIIDAYSLYENLSFVCELQHETPTQANMDALLARVGLEGMGHRKGNELSGGQKQRLAIARALIKQPAIVLADEPTGNLDTQTAGMILDLLKEVSKDHLVVVVSHEPEDAKRYADRSLRIADGRLIADDRPVTIDIEPHPIPLKQGRLSFRRSLSYALQHIATQKGQTLMTLLVLTVSLLLLFLLGAYLQFLDSPSSKLISQYGFELYQGYASGLQNFLSRTQAETLRWGLLILMGAILYVVYSASLDLRIKVLSIYRALGAHRFELFKLLMWESVAIVTVALLLSLAMSFMYLFNINHRFFDDVPYFAMNWSLVGLTFVALVLGSWALVYGLLVRRLKRYPMMDVLKGE